jgi:hypothetical protein
LNREYPKFAIGCTTTGGVVVAESFLQELSVKQMARNAKRFFEKKVFFNIKSKFLGAYFSNLQLSASLMWIKKQSQNVVKLFIHSSFTLKLACCLKLHTTIKAWRLLGD